jgi:molybdate transport system substrate-binding protein
MPALAAAYEKQTGIKLEVSFGSSSALATQIISGSPMDVFLGADFSFPEKVVAANLADEKEPVPYAQGTLVLWARKDSPAQPVSLAILKTPKVTRIAVADEFHAPYGRAAYAAMRSLKIFEPLQAKLVTAENIAQTAQFADTGNAQAAFISLTLANSQHFKDDGSYVYVPRVYPKILQCGVVVKTSKNLAEAHRFLDWLTSQPVQMQLDHFGLQPADH